MTYQPFLIANQKVGKETDQDPFLLPDDAYPELFNAYLYRGNARKKGGTLLLGEGRLGVQNFTLVAARGGANTTYNAALYPAALTAEPIEPGSIVITDGTTTFTDNGANGFTITGGTGTVNTPTNYTTSVVDITFTSANPGATITARFLRKVDNSSPCMGLPTQEVNQTNNNALIAFDRKYSYKFNNTNTRFDNISTYKLGTSQTTTNYALWTGTNYQFFDYCNFQKAFFATNNVAGSHTYAITTITAGATTQVQTSAANNFAVGDIVYINNVTETAVGTNSINNAQAVVSIAGNPFTITFNTTGGTWTGSTGVVWSQTLSKTGQGDGIRWYDGTGWVNFNPPLDAAVSPQILHGGKLLFAYKGRMVVLSTWEGTATGTAVNFQQRARYSQQGNIYYGKTLPTGNVISNSAYNAWYQSPGLGGFEDAPTQESIVGAEFIKDVLVVCFERSTWRLVATNNAQRPFLWEKINTEIGAESTFSTIPFDKEILAISQNGVFACDSTNVERIDQKIPDEVFNFGQASNGIDRVHGIRDFYTQFCFWTYVDREYATATYPNRLLVYNYLDSSWATFENYFTAFGYYQTFNDQTWANTNVSWDNMTVPWNSGNTQIQFPIVVAGNQQGFVCRLNLVSSGDSYPSNNDVSLVIQNISNANPSVFTVPNHNLNNDALDPEEDSFVMITGTGINGLDNRIFRVANVQQNSFTLIDSTGAPYTTNSYTFGGRVTIIDNFEIQTKRFTPFLQLGQKLRLGYIDVFFETNSSASTDPELTMQLFENENYSGPITSISQTVDLSDPGGDVENIQFWKRVYFNQTAQSIGIVFTYSQEQMFNAAESPLGNIAIHALMPWMAPAGRLVR